MLGARSVAHRSPDASRVPQAWRGPPLGPFRCSRAVCFLAWDDVVALCLFTVVFFPAEFLLLRMEPSKKMDSPGSLQTNPPLKPHPDRSSGPSVFVPEQGGYKERFVKAVEDKYKCEKCRLVLCNPKQTECGHRFCETCMAAVLRWAPSPASLFSKTQALEGKLRRNPNKFSAHL